MKLTKKQEAEILSVYKSYWDGYLAGDLKSMVALLDASYTQVGSAEGEVFYTRQKAIKFLKETITQIAGKGKIKKQRIKIEVLKDGVLVNDLFDLYVLADGEWIFYSNFRASTLMKEIRGKWKFIHQHSSVPDIRTAEGENVATEKITAENLQLKDAIKRRTVELEQKNRELEIEAALEKVRTRSLAMQKSEELKEVIQVVFDQFIQLKIDVEHTGFIIDYKTRDDMHIWLADQHKIPAEVSFPYFDSPHWNSFLEAKKKGRNFFTNQLNFKTKNKFYQSLFKLIPGVSEEIIKYYLSCPGLAISTVLLDNVGLYIENFSGTPYSDEENNTLIRFAKVFEQAYTRFLDLQKAEAQARESRIQLALERVRARTMAMHNSSELGEVAAVLFEQISILTEIPDRFNIGIVNEKNRTVDIWLTDQKGHQVNKLFVAIIDKSSILSQLFEAWKRNEKSSTLDLSGELLHQWVRYMNEEVGIPFDKDQIKGHRYINSVFFSHGFMGTTTNEPSNPEQIKLIERFTKVFQQTYTRFLDLQKAEAQAREAQIEAALEKVRSRSLAMHKSDELNEVISSVYDRLVELDIEMDSVNFDIFREGRSFDIWAAAPNLKYSEAINISDIEFGTSKLLLDARESGTDFITAKWTAAEKNKWFKVAFERTGFKHIPEERKQKILDGKLWTTSTALGKFSAIQLNSYSRESFSTDENEIVKRFSKVFDQAYTRFLDLQKAEAQARESKIETSLER